MSNSSDERSPRFTKSILGRILAVLAFIALGTFAVVQSVANKSDIASKMDDIAQLISPQNPGLASMPPRGETRQVKFDGSGIDKPKPKSFSPNDFVRPASQSFPTNRSAAATPKSKTVLASTRRSLTDQTSPASTAPSLNSTSRPIVVAKQATSGGPPSAFSKIPESQSTLRPTNQPTSQPRVAQLNDNFGGRPTADTGNSSLRSLANDGANSASKFADNLRNSVGNSTSNAIENAKSGLRSTLGSAQSDLSNSARNPRSSMTLLQNKQPTTSLSPTGFSDRPPSSRTNFSNSSTGLNSKSAPTGNNFGSTSRTAIPSTPTATTSSSPPALRSSFSSNPVTSRPTSSVPPSSPPPRRPLGQSPTGTFSPVSTSSPLTGTSSSLNAKTKATPGDRQLEGVQAPSLTIEKVAPREIQVNQPADFQIVIRNAGRVTANDVQVFEEIPAGTEFISASPQPSRGAGQQLRWSLGEMRPGQEKRIKLQLKPIRPGEIGSVAHYTFAGQASMRTLVTKPVLEVRHSAQPKVLIGDSVVLDILVENKGDGPANDVIIQEDVPSQLEFSDGFRELEYPIGTLAPGQSKRVRLSLRAAEIGRLKNVLFAKANGGLSAQHAIDMEVIAPQLVSSGTGPSRKFLKREAVHQFSVENKGTADATNVELIARLPSGLKFISANNRGKFDPNTNAVYWSLAELTPNVVGSVEIKTLPIESGEQQINFEAFADLNQKSKTSQSLMVEHLIDVFFDIDDVVDPIEIGSPTNYKIRIENQGTMTATNVRLQIEFPNGIQPISVDGSLQNEIRGQQILFAPISSMTPGDEMTINVTGKGTGPGDHRVIVRMQTDGRSTPVAKEETTRVYDDR